MPGAQISSQYLKISSIKPIGKPIAKLARTMHLQPGTQDRSCPVPAMHSSFCNDAEAQDSCVVGIVCAVACMRSGKRAGCGVCDAHLVYTVDCVVEAILRQLAAENDADDAADESRD